jgi:DNA-binding GntR family transcriptional regulator
MVFKPVNIREEVYKYLRSKIINGHYPPGYRFDLPEIEIELGISRTPLKEALQRLENDGIIDIRPRRGTFVAELDLARMIENFEVRHALERYVARHGLDQAVDADSQNIDEINNSMRALVKDGQLNQGLEKYLELDHQFHMQIVSLSHNAQIVDIYDRLNVHIQIARVRRHYSLEQWQKAQTEHDRMEQAVREHDAAELLQAIDDHIEKAIARLRWALKSENDSHEPNETI